MSKFCQRIPYPHTAISPFIAAVRDYFEHWVHPFNLVVMGNYQKAIQMIVQKAKDANLTSMGALSPILVFSPGMGEPVTQVDHNWKYSTLHPYQVKWNQLPINFYDGNSLSVITRRMSGPIDFKIFCDSAMERDDIFMSLHDAFRGLNKIIPLPRITQCLVVSEEIRLYHDEGEPISINWADSNLASQLIPSINRTKYYLPLKTQPWIQMSSISDASVFYGGDALPEYVLSGTLQYELEIPAMFVIETHQDIIRIDTVVNTGYIPSYGHWGPPAGEEGTDEYGGGLDIHSKLTDWTDLNKILGVAIIERNDKSIEMPTLARILQDYVLDVEAEDEEHIYPFDVTDIPWTVSKNNTVALIYDHLTDYTITGPNSITIDTGPALTSGTFELHIIHYESMVCGEKQRS